MMEVVDSVGPDGASVIHDSTHLSGLGMSGRRLATIALLLGGGAAIASPAENSPDQFGCTNADATACWQAAIQHAMPAGQAPYFDSVTGSPGATYVIRDTLIVESALGGTIDGNGALLKWAGPSDRPMFLARNTQQLRFVNLRILVVTPLQAAFEFAKAPYGPVPDLNVAPSLNVIDSVRVEGIRLGNLHYGVRFSKRYGIDEDNDQSTIINTIIYNVTDAAISIEHTQSQHHHFYAVKASGAPGNKDAAFVRAVGGSFSSLGGFHGGFGAAVYDISSVYGTDLIVDENSEGSARLIRTPAGASSFPFPVHFLGGRFAVNELAGDGRLIDFHRMGPLSIDGLAIDGVPPASAARPVISFQPDPVAGKGQGSLSISNVMFNVADSVSWQPLIVSPAARVVSTSNSCVDAQGNVAMCHGLAAGVISMSGITFTDLAGAPFVTLAPGHTVYCEDCSVRPSSGACVGGGFGHTAHKTRRGWACN